MLFTLCSCIPFSIENTGNRGRFVIWVDQDATEAIEGDPIKGNKAKDLLGDKSVSFLEDNIRRFCSIDHAVVG